MAFGYKGDVTSDSLSEAGTGAFAFDDPERGGKPMVPKQDAALKRADAEEIYHVKPGEFFTDPKTGEQHRYADVIPDWSTAPPGYVDVYDPSHPPDKLTLRSGHEKSATKTEQVPQELEIDRLEPLAKSLKSGGPGIDKSEPLEESPEPAEAAPPKPKRQRPVDTIRQEYPQYAKQPDQALLPVLQKVFPDVPQDKLQVYATQPGGGQMLREYQDRKLSPLEKFRKYYSQFASGDDDKDLELLRNKFYPEMGQLQFKAFANPPNPILSTLGRAYDWITSATVAAIEGTATPKQFFQQFAPNPDRPLNPLGQGTIATAEATYGKWEQFPKAYAAATSVFGQTASDWLAKNAPGYGGTRDSFRNFINALADRGKQWEAQAQKTAAGIPPGAGSQVAGTIGQVIGSTPDMMVSFGLGATGRAAALWGMAYEGISAYGHAIENHQKNALLQGVSSAGFRQFAQYLLNTGKGRIVSGIANMFATVADQEIEKFLRGEPNDITKDGKAATVGFLLPFLLMPKGTPQEAFMEAEPPKPVNAAPDLESLSLQDPVREEISKAQEAQDNGDHDKAAEYIDRGFSLMPDGEKRQVAKDFIDKVDELARDSTKQKLTPRDEQFNEYYFSGLPINIRDKKTGLAAAYRDAEGRVYEAEDHAEAQKLALPDEKFYALEAEHKDPFEGLQAGYTTRDGRFLTREEVETPNAYGGAHGGYNKFYGVGRGDPRGFYETEIEFKARQIREAEDAQREKELDAKELKGRTDYYRYMGYPALAAEAEREAHGEHPNAETERAKQFLREEMESREPGPSFYSGIPGANIAKTIKDWFEGDRPDLIPLFPHSAEQGSEPAQLAGQIVKSEEAASRARLTAGLGESIRRAKARTGWDDPAVGWFEKITGLKWGAPAERLMRFFDTFSKQELIQQFIDYQDKGASAIKDPNARWIWKNVIGPFYDSIEKRERAYGIEHGHQDNYFMQLLKHPKDDLPKLIASVAKATGGLPFVKPRTMRLVERLALNHEMVTTNPIQLMLIRGWMSERAIQKIRDARELEAQGYAWNTKDKGQNIPRDQAKWVDQNRTFGTSDHQSYYVDSRIVPVLNAKFDTSNLFAGAKGPYFKFFAGLKGAVAAKVSWSLFHPIHIMDIQNVDVGMDALQRIMAGKADWWDACNVAATGIPFAGSVPSGVRAYLKYGDAVNYLQGRGKLDFKQLSPDTQRDILDFLDTGIVAETSEERQMQFTRALMENAPKWAREGGWAGTTAKLGLDLLGNPFGFNRWWFGTVTPRLKFASAMMRRDTLLRTRPDLFKPSNRADLLREYGKIHRDIEGRFGEMHYDNLLWPRMAKQLGTTFLLSLGWHVGMFRTMGDGVVDLTRNQAHWNEIVKGWAQKDPAARKLITNRMAFTAAYFARALMTGWAISYFLGGKKNIGLWDGMYPVVGHDDQGKEKRVNMQYFIKDIPAIEEYSRMSGSLVGGAIQMGINKMNPMTMAVLQAATNKDYMGRSIGQLPDRLLYLLRSGLEPMTFERAAVPGQTWGDKLLSALGYSPSGRWTMRSDLGNRIVAEAMEQRNYGPLIDARDRYRQAFLAKDYSAMAQIRQELLKMHVKPEQIHHIEKEAHLTTEQKMFKQLPAWKQQDFWKQMSPEEKREYQPFLKQELKHHMASTP